MHNTPAGKLLPARSGLSNKLEVGVHFLSNKQGPRPVTGVTICVRPKSARDHVATLLNCLWPCDCSVTFFAEYGEVQ